MESFGTLKSDVDGGFWVSQDLLKSEVHSSQHHCPRRSPPPATTPAPAPTASGPKLKCRAAPAAASSSTAAGTARGPTGRSTSPAASPRPTVYRSQSRGRQGHPALEIQPNKTWRSAPYVWTLWQRMGQPSLFRAATPFTGLASRVFGREGWPRCVPSATENCPLAMINTLRKPLADTSWWKLGPVEGKRRGQRCQRLTSER